MEKLTKQERMTAHWVVIGMMGLFLSLILIFNTDPLSFWYTVGELFGYIFTVILCFAVVINSVLEPKK